MHWSHASGGVILDELLPKVVDLKTVSYDILCFITRMHFSEK